jgi:hypothetical protein
MKLPDVHRRLLGDVLACGNTYGLVLSDGYTIQTHDLSPASEPVGWLIMREA